MVGHLEKFSYRVQRKPELSAVSNESEALLVLPCVTPLIAVGAGRFWQQSDLLIVPDRRHFDITFGGKLAD